MTGKEISSVFTLLFCSIELSGPQWFIKKPEPKYSEAEPQHRGVRLRKSFIIVNKTPARR